MNCSAFDIYVAQLPLGLGDGSTSNNAEGFSSFNATILAPGDTLHIEGRLTNDLLLSTSGSVDNPITIYFEPGASLSRTNGRLIYIGGLSNIMVDGGVNGIIENTATGTGMAYSNAATLVDASGAANVAFKNLLFRNQYVHTTTNDVNANIAAAGGVYANGLGGSNYFISCTFSNIGWCLNILASPTSMIVSNCSFYCYDHGVVPGGTNIAIVNSHFDTTANWDTTANAYHHDPIHYFGTTNVSSFIISGNIFTGNLGKNNTAMIYLETAPPNTLIYNNLFLQYPSNYLNDGMVVDSGNNTRILNNTFAGASGTYNSGGLVIGGHGSVVANNLFTSLDNFVYQPNGSVSYSNNIYANQAAGGNAGWATNGMSFSTFAGWTNAMKEANSIYTNASLINLAGILRPTSPAIGAGANLSGVFKTDYAGNARPSTGPWDAGAYQTNTAMVFPPSNLHVR